VIDFLPVWVGDTLSVEQIPGTTYDFHGTTISETGIYESTLTATNGCDSLVYLDIDFIDPCFQPFDLTIEWADPSCEEAQNRWIVFFPDGGTGPYTYALSVTDENGCSVSDNIFINVLERPTLYLPNIFSPNGDGTNEVFRPFGTDAALNRVIEMKIFSRWGELVFEGEKLEAVTGWDGIINGKIAPTGVYMYLLRWTNPLGEEEVFSGDIVIIR
jgi:gliding motility-associated-like protein